MKRIAVWVVECGGEIKVSVYPTKREALTAQAEHCRRALLNHGFSPSSLPVAVDEIIALYLSDYDHVHIEKHRIQVRVLPASKASQKPDGNKPRRQQAPPFPASAVAVCQARDRRMYGT